MFAGTLVYQTLKAVVLNARHLKDVSQLSSETANAISEVASCTPDTLSPSPWHTRHVPCWPGKVCLPIRCSVVRSMQRSFTR